MVGVDARTNTLTVQKQDGEQVSYDPKRLYGVNVFEERSRDFSLGERIQFTAGNRDLGIANRDLGTITALEERSITVRMDGKSGREVTFDPTEFRQLRPRLRRHVPQLAGTHRRPRDRQYRHRFQPFAYQ